MHRSAPAWLIASSFALAGCAAAPAVPIAAAAGAGSVGGGAATSGAQSAAVAAGALGGGLVGATIGRKIEKEDRERAGAAERQSLATNQPVTWRGSKLGTDGEIVPTRTYRDESGGLCREFSETVRIEGQEEAAVGTACQRPNGEWQLRPMSSSGGSGLR